MSEQEYREALKSEKHTYDMRVREISAKYAESQRIFKVGDIAQSHQGIILVKSFAHGYSFRGIPCPIYRGVELTKKLVPKKNATPGAIYGNEGAVLIQAAESEKQPKS